MSFGGGPDASSVQPFTPPPEKSDAEIQSEAEARRRRLRAARGSAANVLTGGAGLVGEPNTAAKTLLGR